MPNWKEHLEVAKRVGKNINLEEKKLEEFLMANLLPDINNSYIVKDISKKISHYDTHYDGYSEPSYIVFYEQYKEYMNTNIAILGYFTHLYTDYIWNRDFYKRVEEIQEYSKLLHNELKIIKQEDFKYYNNLYMDNKLNIKNIEYFMKEISVIDKINLTKEDIEKVISFINNQKEDTHLTLKFYKKEQLDELMNKSVNEISNYLKKHVNIFTIL